jgi:hypothetical protein
MMMVEAQEVKYGRRVKHIARRWIEGLEIVVQAQVGNWAGQSDDIAVPRRDEP